MSKNVVFLPAIVVEGNESRSAPYKYGIDSWKKWCQKNNAELFILDQLIYPIDYMKITWQRYMIHDLLEANDIKYDQVLMMDCDSIIHPDTPNFFEMTDNKFVGIHTQGSYDWVLRSMENYSKYIFNGEWFPFWEYIQGGFQITNKSHKQFYKDIIEFYQNNEPNIQEVQKFHVGTDQPMLNFLLRKHNIDLKLLPWEFSMSDMARKEILDDDMTFTKCGWIYQYNAIPDNHDARRTADWMKKTYEYFYGEYNG